jgi:acyl carrier protein
METDESMTDTAIKEKLFALLDRDFDVDVRAIDPDRSIFDQIPVDSMVLVGIAAGIEQEFGVELPLSFMENPTLSNLLRLIQETSMPS